LRWTRQGSSANVEVSRLRLVPSKLPAVAVVRAVTHVDSLSTFLDMMMTPWVGYGIGWLAYGVMWRGHKRSEQTEASTNASQLVDAHVRRRQRWLTVSAPSRLLSRHQVAQSANFVLTPLLAMGLARGPLLVSFRSNMQRAKSVERLFSHTRWERRLAKAAVDATEQRLNSGEFLIAGDRNAWFGLCWRIVVGTMGAKLLGSKTLEVSAVALVWVGVVFSVLLFAIVSLLASLSVG